MTSSDLATYGFGLLTGCALGIPIEGIIKPTQVFLANLMLSNTANKLTDLKETYVKETINEIDDFLVTKLSDSVDFTLHTIIKPSSSGLSEAELIALVDERFKVSVLLDKVGAKANA